MPIRVSSIRGHLRFWWRATRGASFDTVDELRQREGEIWGSMENPSPVVVEVDVTSRGKTYPCASVPYGGALQFRQNHPQYALFPFQGSDQQGIPIGECTAGISFELTISCPVALSPEINAALWAWVNFGGIGARTRRGCGALYCQDLATQDFANIGGWYSGCLKKLGISTATSREWPTLPEKILIKKGTSADALQCWSDVIGLLQTFRQGVNVGRNLGAQGYPGRSRWPEPETIRTVTNRRSNIRKRIEQIPNDAFPRAELGLPIIFHFKDGGDPADTELSPVVGDEEKTRMASPLILRPLRCKNGDMLQMILQLNSPRVAKVVLKNAPKTPHFTKIRDPGLALYTRSPMGPATLGGTSRSANGSALDAFINFAQEPGKGFTEVP